MHVYKHLLVCLFVTMCYIDLASSGICLRKYKVRKAICKKAIKEAGNNVTYDDCCRRPDAKGWQAKLGSRCFRCVNIVDGNWGSWTATSPCSVTCDSGTYQRRRFCNNPAPLHGGRPCDGKDNEVHPCFSGKRCPINGQWGPWGNWSVCSKSCGRGARIRYKACNAPSPQFGGKDCPGPSEEVEKCVDAEQCPIHGGWTLWSSWSTCNAACGIGKQSRKRDCSNPKPQYNGKNCEGNSVGEKTCKRETCTDKGGGSGNGESGDGGSGDAGSGGAGSGGAGSGGAGSGGGGLGDGAPGKHRCNTESSGCGEGSGSGRVKRGSAWFDDTEDDEDLVVIRAVRRSSSTGT